MIIKKIDVTLIHINEIMVKETIKQVGRGYTKCLQNVLTSIKYFCKEQGLINSTGYTFLLEKILR